MDNIYKEHFLARPETNISISHNTFYKLPAMPAIDKASDFYGTIGINSGYFDTIL